MKRLTTKHVLLGAIIFAQYSCGFLSPRSSEMKARVGFAPVTIPALIQAEDFNAAVDLSKGNSGTTCDETNNPNVDLKAATDEGGGCFVGWTQDGEYLDYYVLNRATTAKTFDIELRVASGEGNSSLTVESPPGNSLGKVAVAADGYQLGWQSWVTRKLSAVSIQPGLQIVRVKFNGQLNLNYLNLITQSPEQAESELIAENVIKRSCAKCHNYLLVDDRVSWSEVIKRAAAIKTRINDTVSPMPPRGLKSDLSITEAEKAALLNYVSGLADHPVEQVKPINTRNFDSRGMKLQRELMAENAGHIWGMTFLPDGTILATVKSGEVKRFDVNTRTFSTIEGAPKTAQHGQGGLLDVGVSSDFGDDGKVFFSYAKDLGNGQFTTALSSAILDGNKLRDLKEIFVATGSNGKGEHFGGRIVVDSDNSIWLSIGERNDRTNAQRLDNHLGKVLRLTEDGKAHPGNPFINGGALPEIYSYGHRNPQGLTKNQLTGEIWEGEHGPKGGDELNWIRPGLNFGWPKATFGTEYDGTFLAPSSFEGTEQPMTYWAPSIAPSGLIVYSSDVMPGWKGLAISGALAFTHLNLTEIRDHKKVSEERLFREDGLRVREVEQGPSGEVWYASDAGHLFRIRPAD